MFESGNGTLAPMDYANKIYLGSHINELFFNRLNIYNPFNQIKGYIFEIEAPVFDSFGLMEQDFRGSGLTKEEYENATYYDINTFTLSWGATWKELLETHDSILFPMFNDLVNEAKCYIRYSWFKSIHKWRKLVSLYIAHHLEIFEETLKDIHNDRSHNARITDENEHRKITIGQTVMKNYDTTIFGRLFWQEYHAVAKYKIYGVIE